MRTFFELLPYRIDQTVIGRWLRARRLPSRRAVVISVTRSSVGRPRLYVDLSVLSTHDAGTGIQRVVRELAMALIDEAPAKWDLHFVGAGKKTRYRRLAWNGHDRGSGAEELQPRPGDVFVGLDYSLDAVRRHRRQLRHFRRKGGALWFFVHDLLPLDRPEWFSANTVIRFKAWLGILAQLADGFLCNSAQTEIELKRALAEQYGLEHGYATKILPMGSAITNRKSSADFQRSELDTPRLDRSQPFVLMVGTLEPRKGHADILAVFDRLWQAGNEERLVLVGRLGWKVEALQNYISSHPEQGARLLWFDDVSDSELDRLYETCTGVIVASHGEGFGLPLIEALAHGKPVLARDLPVFRVHERNGVRFFPARAAPGELEEIMREWLDAARDGLISVTRPTSDWRESARTLLSVIGGRDNPAARS